MKWLERKSQRHPSYNYSKPGYYFLTICTFSQINLFGNISDGRIILNGFGKVIENNLKILSGKFDEIELDYFVIMPNHVHLILINYNNEIDDTDRSKMTISKLIQQFQSSCTKDIRNKFKTNITVWQRSFYDRIIRNEKELFRIRRYIEQNPLKWELEKSIPENLDL